MKTKVQKVDVFLDLYKSLMIGLTTKNMVDYVKPKAIRPLKRYSNKNSPPESFDAWKKLRTLFGFENFEFYLTKCRVTVTLSKGS